MITTLCRFKIAFLVCLVLMVSEKSLGQYSGGDGTLGNPYQIGSLTDLQNLSTTSLHWGNYFIQTSNIDATSTASLNAGAGFSSIGNYVIPFTGSYNGQNFTITGLYINRPSKDSIGLFGVCQTNSSIQNLGLVNVSMVGNNCVGGLVGYIENGTISNCYAEGSADGNYFVGLLIGQLMGGSVTDSYSNGTVLGDQYVGGLIGINYGGIVTDCHSGADVTCAGIGSVGGLIGSLDPLAQTTVSGCYSTGAVEGTNWVGGLVGFAGVTVEIFDSYSSSVVTGLDYVGGLAGYVGYGSTIRGCYATGEVSGEDYVGGLVGIYEEATLSKSYSISNVSGVNWIGGIVGYAYPNAIIENTYAICEVSGASKVGGAIGEMEDATILNSYAAGLVSGSSEVGGFIGNTIGTVNVTNCFWNTSTSSQATSAAGQGINTAAMQTQTTFTGVSWDFLGETTNGSDDIWKMGNVCTYNNYPVFNWQTLGQLPAATVSQNGITLTADEVGATYQWLDCGNAYAVLAGTTTQNFTPLVNGQYAVEVTKAGCKDTSTCISITTAVLKEELDTFMSLYPNPTTGVFYLSPVFAGQTYTIKDNLGHLMATGFVEDASTPLDVQGYEAGVYFVNVKDQVIKLMKW